MFNILYISYDGLTDPLGQSQILPYLKELAKHGYQFTVISFEKKARLEKEGKTVQALANESNISWVPLSFTAKPPVLSKMYDRYRMWRTAVQLHKKYQFDLTHCRSYIAAEMGLKLKQKFGVKMLFDMRGFWADEKVDNGQWDQQNILYRTIYRHYKQEEKKFLQNADGIVSLTKSGKDYLLKQDDYKHLCIDVIPCCADLKHFDYNSVSSKNVEALRTSLGINKDAKVLTYLGSIGGWYLTREMFDFFKLLQEYYPSFVMLLLTKDDPNKVRKEIEEAGVPADKVFITYAERKQLPEYLCLSSCSIFFIRNTFSKMASSPTKHAELMGAGIPVICNDIGDTGKIINQTQTGLIVNELNRGEYLGVILKMENLLAINKEQIRNAAYQFFDLSNGVNKYLGIYKRILGVK